MPKKTNTKSSLVFNHLPKKVTCRDFNRYIKPHLKQGTRGPDPKVSFYKIFNYILYVLHTGIQWYQLKTYKREISWQRVYARHRQWSQDGSYQHLFEASIINLRETEQLDLSTLHGDGSNTVVKKGGQESVTRGTSTRRVKKS